MEPIQKKSTVDLAAEKIVEYIQNSPIQVGEKMPAELSLCKELNISRTTVREAYRLLQSQGYLDFHPGKGAFVKSKERDFILEATEWLSSQKVQIADYLFVRLALDPLAAKLAASNATQQDIDELCAIYNAFIEASKSNDNKALEQLDARFHECIARSTHNDLLLSLVRITNYYFNLPRQFSFRLEEHTQHAIVPHSKILDAITKKHPEEASKASLDHILTAFQDFCGWQPEL